MHVCYFLVETLDEFIVIQILIIIQIDLLEFILQNLLLLQERSHPIVYSLINIYKMAEESQLILAVVKISCMILFFALIAIVGSIPIRLRAFKSNKVVISYPM